MLEQKQQQTPYRQTKQQQKARLFKIERLHV